MTDIAAFAIQIDSSGAKRGADEVAASFDKVGQSAARATRPVDDLLQEISQTKQRADDFVNAQREMATTTAATGTTAAATNVNMAQLGRTMTTATASALGLNGNIVALARSFGPFAMGSAITLGLGLIADRIRNLREEAELAWKPVTDLEAEVDKLIAKRIEEEGGPGQQLAILRSRADEATMEVERLIARLAQLQGMQGAGRDRGAAGAAIGGVERELVEARRLADERARRLLGFEQIVEDDRVKDAEKNAREMERIERERLAKAKAALAEREALLKEEQRLLRMHREIYAEFFDPETISGPRGSQVRASTSQVVRGQQLLAEDTGMQAETKAINALFRDTASVLKAVAPQQAKYAEELERQRRALLDQVSATEATRYAAVDLVAALGIVPDSVLNLADTLIRVKANMDASKADGGTGAITGADALSLATAGIGIVGQIIQSRRAAELEAARLKSAQAEFDRTLARLVDSIGPRSRLQEELARLAEEFERLAQQAAQSRNILLTGDAAGYNADTIAARRAEIEAEVASLSATTAVRRLRGLQAEAAFLDDIERILGAIAQQEAELQRLAKEREARLREDLEVRGLRAQGRGPEADALALQIQHVREFADAVKEGMDALTLSSLSAVQALEAQALANKQLEETIRNAQSAEQLGLDLDARERRLTGDDAGAQAVAASAKAIREMNEAGAMLAAGLIDQATYDRWIAVIDGELQQVLDEIAEAAKAAADALQELKQSQMDNLEIRYLVAIGMDEEAAAMGRWLRYQEERANAVDDEVRAIIDMVYAAEEQARAVKKAADEIKAYNDALRAQADFVANLRERELRATGFAGAADEFAMTERFKKEIREAEAAGRTATELAELRRVQALEREFADAERRRRQDEAFNQGGEMEAPGFESDSRTGVNLAVGISETTGSRLAGIMTSQLTYQSFIPRIYDLMAAQGGARPTTGGVGFSSDAMDAALAQSAADSAADLGYLPGMRN